MFTFPCLLLNFVPSAFIISGKCAYRGGTQLNALKAKKDVKNFVIVRIDFSAVQDLYKSKCFVVDICHSTPLKT